MSLWYQAALRTFLDPTTSIDWVNDNISLIFVDTADYTVDGVNHDFKNDIPTVAIVGPDAGTPMTSKTVSGNGFVDAADTLVPSVSGAEDPFEAIVIFKETGAGDASNRLILYIDGFGSITPNGGDITVVWDAVNLIARL